MYTHTYICTYLEPILKNACIYTHVRSYKHELTLTHIYTNICTYI